VTRAARRAILCVVRRVIAAVGDSCGVLSRAPPGAGIEVEELVPEHAPTNVDDWRSFLAGSGLLAVYSHEAMFDGPDQLLHVFRRDEAGGWFYDDEALKRADTLGVGFKTERGDRATVILTPEEGPFSQMMLGVSRSLGDFYHQSYGLSWRPQVVVRDVSEACGAAPFAVLLVASDGVWDHWTFEAAMAELMPTADANGHHSPPDKAAAMAFFEKTRANGAASFGDQADNLTGVVLCVPRPLEI